MSEGSLLLKSIISNAPVDDEYAVLVGQVLLHTGIGFREVIRGVAWLIDEEKSILSLIVRCLEKRVNIPSPADDTYNLYTVL